MNLLLCPDATPNFLGTFDLSIAPTLLFYAYIPVILLSLFVSLYIFVKDKRSLTSKSLFTLSAVFALWVINVLIQWTGAAASLVMISWQIMPIIENSFYVSGLYFTYVFINGKDAPKKFKTALFLALVPAAVLVTSPINITSFDLPNCQGNIGPLWDFYYVLQLISLFVIVDIFLRKYRAQPKKSMERRRTLITFISMLAFIGTFYVSNISGVIFQYDNQTLSTISASGMAVFLLFLLYLIVKFGAFKIKLLAAQALVGVLASLTFAILFIRQIQNVRIVTIITLVLVLVIGYILIKNVKREVEQREKIERQEKELERVNARLQELDQLKSEFVSLATHQVRGPLTAIKGYASLMLEGDYGEVPQNLSEPIETIYKSSQSLAVVVEDFLNVSRIEQGRMKYDFSDFDFAALVKEVVGELRPTIDKKGLAISVSGCDSAVSVHGDRGKLKQVIGNLLDNSIKYTPKGNIAVSLKTGEPAGKVILSIKDTGVGIRPETIPHLFQKFSRAEDASKVNILGTGLGLYVAREMLKANGGRIWVESEGEGRGATFFVELALV